MSLDGAILKVVRAQEHLDSLKDEIERYLKTDPYVVNVQKNSDGWGGDAAVIRQPDPRLSTIIGDCLHNARCALDYIMWELAGTYAGRVLIPPPTGDDKCYFPITTSDKSFGRLSVPRVNNRSPYTLADYKIPDRVIIELRAMQPYHAGYEPIGMLNTLINVDKHRLPLVIFAFVSMFEIVVSQPVYRPGLPPPIPTPGVQAVNVQTQAAIGVAWEDVTMPRESVHRTLENIVKCVADI